MTTPLVVASLARERGTTGVHTHVHQLRRHIERVARPGGVDVVTPHTWAGASLWRRAVLGVLFGARLVLERVSGPAHVAWYRASHAYFLRRALQRRLRDEGPCAVYAQCPVAANAALRARRGPHQRVVLAVHFRVSQADEWANKGSIARDGLVHRRIRAFEHRVVPQVDGLVFVSQWARSALLEWMPEAGWVEGTVLHNFVEGVEVQPVTIRPASLVTTGSLEPVKNHRYLLQVLAAARGLGHDHTLDVLGEGPERGGLLALATELGVHDLLRLQGFCTDVQQRLPGHAAYVHASYSESSSLAIMEAMAAGLPVVSGLAGALGELFDDPGEGRFWPLDDAEAAARVLIDLTGSAVELRRAGAAARERFLRDYEAAAVAPRLVGFLEGDPSGLRR